jgi:hypothetical protein
MRHHHRQGDPEVSGGGPVNWWALAIVILLIAILYSLDAIRDELKKLVRK